MVVAGPLYLMNGKINQVLLTKAAARPLPPNNLARSDVDIKSDLSCNFPLMLYNITKLAIQYVYVHFFKICLKCKFRGHGLQKESAHSLQFAASHLAWLTNFLYVLMCHYA